MEFEIARWMFAAWFLLTGGAVGSFLNVVVYRLPAGMNISWPGSHCPRCKHAIRAYDNIPVLAWFWLRGRCRDCREPISFRYPLVEAVTAGLFLLLLVVEVFHGGQNLPVRMPQGPHPYPPVQALVHLPVPSGPAVHAHGRRADPAGTASGRRAGCSCRCCWSASSRRRSGPGCIPCRPSRDVAAMSLGRPGR